MISVCMATYNGEKYIKEQLDSILCQLRDNDEIIISDDDSTDLTLNIIKTYNDTRIKIFSNKGEKGYTGNFENALQKASGDFIFLSDQDDIWVNTKVERCLHFFQKYDMIISDALLIDEKANVMNDSFFSIRKPRKSLLGNIYKFGYLGCCIAFKKEVLNKALPFPKKRKLCTHDHWLVLTGLCFFKCLITNEKLVYYRRYANNTSAIFQSNTSIIFKIHYRLYLVKNLLLRK